VTIKRRCYPWRFMILKTGTRVGPFEIVGPLGAGGMGEVYRARDPRIALDVALKILPPAFAESADRLRRFELEARATGALTHPNLLTIFDIGTHGGLPFIVSELLEGSTLRDRLGRPLAPRRAVDYALQIARGLAAAHEKAIVHRDLKPENIFITSDERVKLLDFGLAKVLADDAGSAAETQQRAASDTHSGAVIGTAAYMSPEQVRGQSVDHRSDVFSFGVVFHEMLAGRRPFDRTSSIETMNAILHDDPAPLPATVPPPLERIAVHALEKSPAQRFQSFRDIIFALETFSGSDESAVIPKSRTTKTRQAKRSEPAVRDVAYHRVTFRRGFIMSARFASDGSIVYGATWEDQPLEIYSALPGSPESRPVGLPSADVLSVSQSGEIALSLGRRFTLGWVTSGTLARVPLFGGAPRELCEDVQDADWSPDGRALAVIRHSHGGHVIEYPLGNPIFESGQWISNIRVSPKGDRLAFLEHQLWGDDGGCVVVIDRAGERLIASTPSSSSGGLAWTPKGDELWSSAMTAGQGRDVTAVSMTGRERIVLPIPGRSSVHDISPDGRLLIAVENARREVIVGARGAEWERNISWLDWPFPTGLSPDGTRILIEEQGSARQHDENVVYIRNVDGSPAVRLGEGRARSFSPDGRWVGIRTADKTIDIVPTGAGTSRRVAVPALESYSWWLWMPDGQRLVIFGNEPGSSNRHFELPIDGSAPPRPITPAGSGWMAAFSPDSEQIAFAAPDGRLMIAPVAGGEPVAVAGCEKGEAPLQWSDDGGSLFVCRPGRLQTSIDRIEIATGSRSPWQLLRPGDPAGIQDLMPIYITRDGSRYAYGYRRFLSDLYVVNGLMTGER